MRDLQASLRDHPMAMLRVIAELNGLELTTNVREDAGAELADELRAPGAAAAALRRCSPAAQAAWQALAAAAGKMKVPAFTRQFGALRPVGPGKLERDMPWREPAGPAEELWYRGLIYRRFANLGGGPAEYFYIPEDLLAAVLPASAGGTGGGDLAPAGSGAGPAPLVASSAPVASPPAAPLVIDACTVLADLAEAPLRLDAGGAWRPADEAHLRERLLSPEPLRCAMLLTLMREAGWLAPAGGPGSSRLFVRGDTTGSWLHSTSWEQLTALFAAWRASTEWNELRRMPSLRAEGEWRNDPRLAREAVLTALSRLEPGAWYSIAGIAGWLKDTNPDFQRPDGNYGGWYLRDAAGGNYLSGFESWDDVEGRLIYFLITEPLSWLSAVELAVADEGGREVCRLTPAGQAWICGQAPPPLPAPQKLRVDEDFAVTAPFALPLLDRYRLLRFTEAAAGGSEPSQATLHRITRRSLARARAGGLKPDKIVQFLRHATGGRLPLRVETALERWQQHGGAVHITRGAVLRVDDAAILAALRADPALAPLLGELLSAQAVLVSTANLPRLLAALAEMGYSTQVDG